MINNVDPLLPTSRHTPASTPPQACTLAFFGTGDPSCRPRPPRRRCRCRSDTSFFGWSRHGLGRCGRSGGYWGWRVWL